MTSSIVFEITRLWFHIKAYTGKDEYESRYLIMEGVSRHQGRQQGCPVIERRIMATKNNSRNYNDQKENYNGGKWYT